VHLPALKIALERAPGNTLPLPLIKNAKTVDPRDPASPKVYQLETAMGSGACWAFFCFDDALSVFVFVSLRTTAFGASPPPPARQINVPTSNPKQPTSPTQQNIHTIHQTTHPTHQTTKKQKQKQTPKNKKQKSKTKTKTAIECFATAGAVVVPRSRFAPVKTCADLFVLRSDAYALSPAYTVEPTNPTASVPLVKLDDAFYKLVAGFERLVPRPPSLVGCKSLVVKGAVRFGPGVVFEGDVVLEAHAGATAAAPATVSRATFGSGRHVLEKKGEGGEGEEGAAAGVGGLALGAA